MKGDIHLCRGFAFLREKGTNFLVNTRKLKNRQKTTVINYRPEMTDPYPLFFRHRGNLLGGASTHLSKRVDTHIRIPFHLRDLLPDKWFLFESLKRPRSVLQHHALRLIKIQRIFCAFYWTANNGRFLSRPSVGNSWEATWGLFSEICRRSSVLSRLSGMCCRGDFLDLCRSSLLTSSSIQYLFI